MPRHCFKVDAPLDGVAPLVGLAVEGGWPAATAASTQSVVPPPATPLRCPVREQRLDPRPLRISQRHAQSNDQMIRTAWMSPAAACCDSARASAGDPAGPWSASGAGAGVLCPSVPTAQCPREPGLEAHRSASGSAGAQLWRSHIRLPLSRARGTGDRMRRGRRRRPVPRGPGQFPESRPVVLGGRVRQRRHGLEPGPRHRVRLRCGSGRRRSRKPGSEAPPEITTPIIPDSWGTWPRRGRRPGRRRHSVRLRP